MIIYLPSKFIIFLIPDFLKDNFEVIKHACDFKICPSFNILSLFAFNVCPVLVISDTISEVPVNGATSVLPRLFISLNCVTPFEYKKSLVKFKYFVLTLIFFFFLSLNSKAISSRSAIV